jgi:hypothetical protein
MRGSEQETTTTPALDSRIAAAIFMRGTGCLWVTAYWAFRASISLSGPVTILSLEAVAKGLGQLSEYINKDGAIMNQ